MIDAGPSHKPVHPLAVLAVMTVAALIGVALIFFGTQ
jgi:hypothetical protein